MPDTLSVEIVFALPDDQLLLTLEVESGATAYSVVEHSGIRDKFAPRDFSNFTLGVWGRPVERGYKVQDGDRIEIYRPLDIDPREARRRLALSGRTMGQSADD
jgi:hypothetical protein